VVGGAGGLEGRTGCFTSLHREHDLTTGTLRIDRGGKQTSFTVSGGFLQVVDNQVTVLSESASAA